MSIIKAKSIDFWFGKKKILNDINLSIKSGDLVGIVGPNGSGKTTLLKILANLIKSDIGNLCLYKQPYSSYSDKRISQLISYLPQEIEMNWPLSVYKTVELGLIPHLDKISKLKKSQIITKVMEDLAIQNLSKDRLTELSTGEKSRVMLARALVFSESILIADEPISSLDPYYQLMILTLLKRKVSFGGVCIITIHDLTLAGRFCNYFIMLKQGKIISSGNRSDVLTKQNIKRAFAVDVNIRNNEDFEAIPSNMFIQDKADNNND
ncbi:ABC transporter ATP-binding protein [Alphaproteobacteria bacterium]|nr:ABC transporter ATP-binding protein [Alphaproteobacteria bacterium]